MLHIALLFFIGILLGLANLKSTFLILTPLVTPSFLLLTFSSHQKISFSKRFIMGWVFGLGYFLVSLYWIPNALLVEANQFSWLVPFAFLGIPAICALLMGASWIIIPWMHTQGVLRVGLFCLSWLLMECMLYLPFGGFPWSLIGYVWHRSLPMAQIAHPFTIHGLSLLTLIWGSFYYLLIEKRTKLARFSLISTLILSFLGCYLWGMKRLSEPNKIKDLPSLRMIQPNIPQKNKWHPAFQKRNLRKILKLSYASGSDSQTLIIWPEAALTYNMTPSLLRYITKYLNAEQFLITGVLETAPSFKDSFNVYNSLIVLNNRGHIIEKYRKHHRVPFGEYIPASSLLNKIFPHSLRTIAGGRTQTLRGKKPQTIQVSSDIQFSPQICFETLFGSLVSSKPEKPLWILNLTNDAWFGRSTGPYQHLQISRFRAIQANLPVVRAASTGISAVIDNHGRIIKSLPYGQAGVIDVHKKDQIRRSGQEIWSSLTGRL
ncbi:MAG: apolipoprotein N-acyltransferase [Alphaproteobacteria bacterium]|nr:MAG: apolipoprotein N-acyltransferase [Alphaproteobacteria bacterium]